MWNTNARVASAAILSKDFHSPSAYFSHVLYERFIFSVTRQYNNSLSLKEVLEIVRVVTLNHVHDKCVTYKNNFWKYWKHREWKKKIASAAVNLFPSPASNDIDLETRSRVKSGICLKKAPCIWCGAFSSDNFGLDGVDHGW